MFQVWEIQYNYYIEYFFRSIDVLKFIYQFIQVPLVC